MLELVAERLSLLAELLDGQANPGMLEETRSLARRCLETAVKRRQILLKARQAAVGKAGKKPSITQEQQGIILRMSAAGTRQLDIAQAVGCSVHVVQRTVRKAREAVATPAE